MKAPVDKATTARVLAGIDAVLRERTAEAVERVLATASPDISGEPGYASMVFRDLYADLNIAPLPVAALGCGASCPCADADIDAIQDHATPGMTERAAFSGRLRCSIDDQQRRYAPWVVSPHLFEAVDQ